QHAPAAALQLQQHVICFWIGGIHGPDISVLPGAARGTVSETRVMLGETRAQVARLAVCQQSHFAVGHIIAIELEPLAAANVFAENEEAVIFWRELGSRSAVGKECKLRACPAWHFDKVDLWHISKASADQHLAPRGVPAAETGGPELAILVCFLRDHCRDLRNVFHH